jgi:hypothetical protein
MSASRLGTVTAIDAIVRQDDRRVRRMELREAAGRCCCLTPEGVTGSGATASTRTGQSDVDSSVGE